MFWRLNEIERKVYGVVPGFQEAQDTFQFLVFLYLPYRIVRVKEGANS